jgi:colanic acid/amylovoran biosynthesis protein
MSKRINIFIAEEIPSLNKGEAAILHGMMVSFKKIKNLKVSMLSFNQSADKKRYKNVEIIPFPYQGLLAMGKLKILLYGIFFSLNLSVFCYLYFFLRRNSLKIMKNKIWRAYADADILIFGHDALLESFGGKKTIRQLFTFIFTYWQIILVKKFLKKPVVIYGASIGEYSNKLVEFLAKKSLKTVDLITLREEFSYNYLKALGVDSKAHLTADFAFLMPPATKKRINKIISMEKINLDRRLVGFTVSKELYQFTFPELDDKSRYEKYIELKAMVIDFIIKDFNADVILIPHSFKKNKEDKIVLEDIYERAKNKNNIKLIAREYSPQELKAVIGLCDLFIGERTHSNIAAVSSGVPTISISEPLSHRNNGILGKIIGEDLVCDVRELDLEKYKEKINEVWKNRAEIKKDLKDKTKIIKKLSLTNGQLIVELIKSLEK